jgi:glycosyltransferase involved in cell wall biosynthesis
MSLPVVDHEALPTTVLYVASRYQSHARAARDNRLMIGHENLAASLHDAGIVILHIEPHDYASIFNANPELKNKYVIAYCVWEADSLPDRFIRSLALVDEVWTCSQYCARIFARYHCKVICIPHVIHRSRDFQIADTAKLQAELDFNPAHKYFLYVTKLWDKRKNTGFLVDTVARLANTLPSLRLIIKCPPEEDQVSNQGNVLFLSRQLTESEMNALYALSSAYVSPHHSEGWGYTLSDAMFLGTPVIATGYSGNLEFMTADNAFLIDALEDYVKPADEYHLFNRSMRWGYPDQADLVRKVTMLYEQSTDAAISGVTENAREAVRNFEYSKVSAMIHKQLAAVSKA